jgi:dUTP pyrophosphatase
MIHDIPQKSSFTNPPFSNNCHIFIKMTNETREDKTVEIQQGIGFAQGIFLEYGITLDDCTDGIRNGGLGSTTR